MITFFPLLASSLLACKAPPEAPSELNDLAGFLFERFEDEDTRDLEQGVLNLEVWLESNLDDSNEENNIRDGYTVSSLKESVIDAVDPDPDRDLSNLAGASVATESQYSVTKLAKALTVTEQEDIFDSYNSHDREFLTDESCFTSQECEFLDTNNTVDAKYGGLLPIVTESRAQYRWLEVGEDDDLVLLHRTWLQSAEISGTFSSLSINEQIYVGITMPWQKGSLRLGTTWIAVDLNGVEVPENLALDIMVDSMRSEGENLDDYLSQ